MDNTAFTMLDQHARDKCQVFTPDKLVDSMLDLAGYKEDIINKRILENSFGEGAFLVAIVDRYISCGIRQGLSADEIRQGLERDIVGYEIDKQLAQSARSKLDSKASEYGIGPVNWNLRIEDALHSRQDNETYSYIVGNPPYLAYKEIDPEYRSWLRDTFESCNQGKFDYCYAFVEHALSQLSKNGTLVQLVPGSLFKNVFGETLREKLKPGITTIIDYANENVFGDALVSPCVFRFDKGKQSRAIKYHRKSTDSVTTVKKTQLEGKWVFSQTGESDTRVRFGDLFNASMPVATLRNDAFLLASDSDVEADLIRAAYSPRTSRAGKANRILFPYYVTESGSIGRYSVAEFENQFPKAAKHLRSFKSSLDERKADASAEWFEYGRSQGLRHVPEEKLLMSTVATNDIAVYELGKNTVAFAGIVITAAAQGANLALAKKHLESEAFSEYAHSVGTSISGSSVRITCRDVAEYRIPCKWDEVTR